MITFRKDGFKPDGSIRWRPIDAQTGADHDKESCTEFRRTGSTDGNGIGAHEPDVKLVERDGNHTTMVLGNKGNQWVIEIRKLNNSRMT